MVALDIIISSDSSDESVGSSPSRVILFGDIPTVIPSTPVIASETSAIAPVISSATPVVETTIFASPTRLCGLVPYSDSDSDSPDEMASPKYITPLPATSPFLFTDSSEDFDPSEASDSSEAPSSQDPYVAIVSRWRIRVTTRSSSPSDFPIASVTTPPETRRRAAILIRPEETIPLGRPYHTRPNRPRRDMTARKRVGLFLLIDFLEACQAHSGSSTRVMSPRLGYPSSHHREIHQRDHSLHSARPSCKRCRSLTDSVPSFTLVMGSLCPTRADLLPPRKRFRDSCSPETSMEEDTEINTTETEDGRELDIIDGDDVRDHIEVDPRDNREEFEASAGDTVVLGIDPRSVPMVDGEIIKPVGGDSSSSYGTRDGTVRPKKNVSLPIELI
nr:hypothetical protein [Tanacetum cinerariifolium]